MLFFFVYRLLVVNHFRHANLQIGDKAFYTLKACDLRHVSNGDSSLKQQTSDNDITEGLDELTEHAYTTPPSDSQTEGCGVHEVQTTSEGGNVENANTAKISHGETLAKTGDAVISVVGGLSSEGSTESFVTESDSKNSSASTSTSSLGDSNLPVDSTTVVTSSNKRETNACVANEASGGTNQMDIPDSHHAAGSDSADADEDSDGGETVTPKTKGAGSLRHDTGPSHTVRYPTKRRKKRLRRKRKVAPPLKVDAGDKVCVEVTHTCTTVDVIWQDGSAQEKILSTDLTPVFHLDELEFFPGDYISDKRGENYHWSVFNK